MLVRAYLLILLFLCFYITTYLFGIVDCNIQSKVFYKSYFTTKVVSVTEDKDIACDNLATANNSLISL